MKNEYQNVPEKYRYLIDNPQARLEIREKFYKKFGRDTNILLWIWRIILRILSKGEGEGRSEIDFLKWEIKRGVLDPMDQGGSAWWRNVNLEFIIISETAGDIKQKKHKPEPENNEINHWLNYIEKRTGKAWYRAHNASIVRGYLNHVEEAKKESRYEQAFMNEVLYRLLFAQALEEGDTAFGQLGTTMANPMLGSVNLIVSIPSFYPDDYPLSPKDVKHILHKCYNLDGDLENILDEKIIIPHLEILYNEAAEWLNIPELKSFVKNGKAIYPHI